MVEEAAAFNATSNGSTASQAKSFGPVRADTQPDPIFSPGVARAAFSKRRMSMQDSIDVSQINRNMYLDHFMSSNRPPKIIIENQDGEIQLPESVRSNTPEHPYLDFSLQHDAETSVLTVFVARSSNLRELLEDFGGQFTFINPFCKLQLMPAASTKGIKQLSGKVHKNTWEPNFAEQFTISVHNSELDARSLCISIYHDECSATTNNRHCGTADLCIGHVLVPLANLRIDRLLQLRREIKAGEAVKNEQPPVIQLGLSYLPTAERLTINVSKVTNLLHSATTAINVKVAVYGDGNSPLKCKRTSTVKVSEQCANVNETVNFNLPKRPIDAVFLRVSVQQFRGFFPFRKRIESSCLDFGGDLSSKSNSDAAQHWQDMLTGKDSKTSRWHSMSVQETMKKPLQFG